MVKWAMKEGEEKAVSGIKRAAVHNHPSRCSFSFLSLFSGGVRGDPVPLHEIPRVVSWPGMFYLSVGDAHPGGCWFRELWELLGTLAEALECLLLPYSRRVRQLHACHPSGFPSHLAASRSS